MVFVRPPRSFLQTGEQSERYHRAHRARLCPASEQKHTGAVLEGCATSLVVTVQPWPVDPTTELEGVLWATANLASKPGAPDHADLAVYL